MPCPTCNCEDWTPAVSFATEGPPSFLRRLGAGLRSIFGGGHPDSAFPRRQCLRCGTVYTTHPGLEDEADEDVIAERLSRIESQMSGFGVTFPPPMQRAQVVDPSGLQIRPKQEMKCQRCGHFAFVLPTPEATCPNCGRLYEKVDEAVKHKQEAKPNPKPGTP